MKHRDLPLVFLQQLPMHILQIGILQMPTNKEVGQEGLKLFALTRSCTLAMVGSGRTIIQTGTCPCVNNCHQGT